jgi:two-component system sensor histidine kinase KdpD
MDHSSAPPSPVASPVQAYLGALAIVAGSTLVGLLMAPHWGTGPVDMIYLPSVLAAAALYGLGPGIGASVAAALAYNFFFTEPVHTFRMNRAADLVTVLVLLLVALVTSRLAAGIRAQAQVAASHAARNATIAGFARQLLSRSGEKEIAIAACAQLHNLLGCNVMFVSGLPTPDVVAAVPEDNRLNPSDLAAAALALESGERAGRLTSRLQPADWVFHPVRRGVEVLGAVGLARDDGAPPVDDSQLLLFDNLLDQLALALERARLEREAQAFATTRERDRLRTDLLSSIGQDLRPRLTAIDRAVRELRRTGNGDQQLLTAIGQEAVQLDRYVASLVELGPEGDQPVVESHGVRIDLFNRAIARDGAPVHLTPKEYAVLAELAKHRGRVLSHAHLLRSVWGPAQERQIEYLRVAIRALRQKLERDPARPKLILNEPAIGYRLHA